ncbi:hypothetical protein Tco_0543368 [Tanacetum coccineum]
MGSNEEIRRLAQEAEKQQLFAQKVQQQNTNLTSQLEMYKERVRILEGINKDNNYLNEFLEADERAKHYNRQAQSQFVHMALPPRDQRHQYLRMLMEHRDAQGVSLFTSQAWRRLFDIRGQLVHELILEFFSKFRFGEAVIDLDTAGALLFQLGGTVGFGAYWVDSTRQIPNKGNLRDYWIGISSAGDFLGTVPSYTTIQDPILMMCHRDTPRIDRPKEASRLLRLVPLRPLRMLLLSMRVARLFRHPYRHLSSHHHLQLLLGLCHRGWPVRGVCPWKQRNIDEYWWRIYKSGDLEVLES